MKPKCSTLAGDGDSTYIRQDNVRQKSYSRIFSMVYRIVQPYIRWYIYRPAKAIRLIPDRTTCGRKAIHGSSGWCIGSLNSGCRWYIYRPAIFWMTKNETVWRTANNYVVKYVNFRMQHLRQNFRVFRYIFAEVFFGRSFEVSSSDMIRLYFSMTISNNNNNFVLKYFFT